MLSNGYCLWIIREVASKIKYLLCSHTLYVSILSFSLSIVKPRDRLLLHGETE